MDRSVKSEKDANDIVSDAVKCAEFGHAVSGDRIDGRISVREKG
jgi:hypothetical protein